MKKSAFMISSEDNAIIGISSGCHTLPSELKGKMFRCGIIVCCPDLPEYMKKVILARFSGKTTFITIDPSSPFSRSFF